jgi:hypothetical protein
MFSTIKQNFFTSFYKTVQLSNKYILLPIVSASIALTGLSILTVNANVSLETFDTQAAGWVGSNNTANSSNFGWSNTNNTGGNSAGEVGGTFNRASTTQAPLSRPHFGLPLSAPITDANNFTVSGELFVGANSSSEVLLAFQDSSQNDNLNFMGIRFNDAGNGGDYRPGFTWGDNNPATGYAAPPCNGASTTAAGYLQNPEAALNSTPTTFAFSYDSTTRIISGNIGGTTIPNLTIPLGQTYTANSFGLSMFANNCGTSSTLLFIDAVNATVDGIGIFKSTLGSTTATTVAPIVGQVGTSFPTINMTGSNIANNVVATFTPAGTTTIITGKIQGGNFVADAGQNIPLTATTGPATGVLKSTGAADVNVPTNFTAVPVSPTLGSTTATTVAPIVGQVGTSFPTINMTGSNLTNGTVATFTPAGTTIVVTGKIQGGNFVADAGQNIPLTATTGPATGVLKSAGAADVNVPTNFTAVPTLGSGGVITIGIANNSSTTKSNPSTTVTLPTATASPSTTASLYNDQSTLDLKDPYVCSSHVYGVVISNPSIIADMFLEFSQNGKVVKTYNLKTNSDGTWKQYLPDLAFGFYNYKVTASYGSLSDSEAFDIDHKPLHECPPYNSKLNVDTVRTGADSKNDIMAIVMIIMGLGLAMSIISKNKSEQN